MGHGHECEERQLFIDTSKVSLKGVLLHIGNEFLRVLVFRATQTKESYEHMHFLLSYLKIIALLVGMQLGLTKLCCFLCECNSCEKDCHFSIKEWPKCEQFQPGQKNVRKEPLVHQGKHFYLCYVSSLV
jgi:hypothetical protein